MVYIWKIGNTVISHADLGAAEELDGLSAPPDMAITEDEYYNANGLIRVINGEIILGKTAEEEAKEETLARIAEIDAHFLTIEQKIVRPMLAKIRDTATNEDNEKFDALAAELEALRAERQGLASALSNPFS